MWMFFLFLLLLTKPIPCHCRSSFDYMGYYSWLNSTVVGIGCCGPHNMESPQSQWRCRIHNILANADTKREYMLHKAWCKVKWCEKGSFCNLLSRIMHRGHCSIPQSCDVWIFPIVLLDVLNCCCSKFLKQLICLKYKYIIILASRYQKEATMIIWQLNLKG